MATFDHYAENYRALVSRAARLSGEDADYFVRYKFERIRKVHECGSTPRRVLDIGCGVGLLTELLARRWPETQVTGIDLSPRSLEHAASRCQTLGNVVWRPYDGETLPAGTSSADLVVLSNVLHHIAETARPAFMERVILPALSPGGRVVMFEHNPYNPVTRRAVRLCPFDRDARLISRRAAIDFLSRHGLRVTQCEYVVFFPRVLWLLRPLEERIGWLPLGAQYMVVADREARS